MSAPMVQAILAHQKIETRRVVAASNTVGFTPLKRSLDFSTIYDNGKLGVKVCDEDGRLWRGACKWQPGDLIWVKETFARPFVCGPDDKEAFLYKSEESHNQGKTAIMGYKWKPSLFMPKHAARIWLRVTSAVPWPLHFIKAADAINEGIKIFRPVPGDGPAKTHYYDYINNEWILNPIQSFLTLWESINGFASWLENPMVWVIKFEVLSTTGKPHVWKGKQLRVDEEASMKHATAK